LTDGGITTGVELESGEIIEAKNVLSSAGSAETLRMCGEVPVDFEQQNPPGEISYAETIFSLDCEPQDLGHDQTIVFYNDSDVFSYEPPSEPCDVSSGIICSPNNFQYSDHRPCEACGLDRRSRRRLLPAERRVVREDR
jgi:hypothetical protein